MLKETEQSHFRESSKSNKAMLATTIKVGKIALITVAALRGAYDVYQVGAWGVTKVFTKKGKAILEKALDDHPAVFGLGTNDHGVTVDVSDGAQDLFVQGDRNVHNDKNVQVVPQIRFASQLS